MLHQRGGRGGQELRRPTPAGLALTHAQRRNYRSKASITQRPKAEEPLNSVSRAHAPSVSLPHSHSRGAASRFVFKDSACAVLPSASIKPELPALWSCPSSPVSCLGCVESPGGWRRLVPFGRATLALSSRVRYRSLGARLISTECLAERRVIDAEATPRPVSKARGWWRQARVGAFSSVSLPTWGTAETSSAPITSWASQLHIHHFI